MRKSEYKILSEKFINTWNKLQFVTGTKIFVYITMSQLSSKTLPKVFLTKKTANSNIKFLHPIFWKIMKNYTKQLFVSSQQYFLTKLRVWQTPNFVPG